jgi:hypothetical protein
MVNEKNIQLIENKKAQMEEVREINYQVPSFEEFMKSYEPNEEMQILTEAEYQDRLLHGPQYGPGNEQSKTATKVATGIGISVLTAICPPAGAAAAGGLAAGAGAVTVTGLVRDDKEVTIMGLEMFSIGAGGFVGGASGAKTHSGNQCSLPICPKK